MKRVNLYNHEASHPSVQSRGVVDLRKEEQSDRTYQLCEKVL